ncbi:MAG TPA: FGGY family carbohydrate kinase [Gaiellaceae bacterium]|nr:FGGY family carbohydrate kinase [Gaiellaceae bacterium]
MLLAADQGTTGTTCLVVDDELVVHGRGYVGVSLRTPRPGWVEQDPEELWSSVERAAEIALAAAGIAPHELDAFGIANQRETTLVWDRRTGRPVYPAIVWQDRRTAERCRELPADLIRNRTGLTCDPYFSATKLEWILRENGRRNGLAFGTVDTWLLWKLTNGAVHATDATNASRTLLLDLATLRWDDELLAVFGVDAALLPEVHPSAHAYGEGKLLGATVPVAALAGDQQAALFAHGGAKVTLGTGAFLLVGTGDDCSPPPHGLVRTAAAGGGYALEGSVFVAGAALQWLRDKLGLFGDAADSEALARSVDSTEGVYFVPALTGLGSPHWAPDARGLVSGLSTGTRREHLVRAALESIAYQVLDVVDALPNRPAVLGADGGATANGFLMQFLADALQIPVEVAAEREMTALGAAALIRPDAPPRAPAARYEPGADVSALVAGWREAVGRTLT